MRRRRYLTLLGGTVGAASSVSEAAGSVARTVRRDALDSLLETRSKDGLSNAVVAPESGLTVEPGTEVLFEVSPDDLGTYGGLTSWSLDGEQAGLSMGPWYAEYAAWKGADYWTTEFESEGSYAVDAVVQDIETDDEVTATNWEIDVADGGIAAPTIESASPDPETTVLPADESIDLELDVAASDGSLDRVVWWLNQADVILGVSDVSGSTDTAVLPFDGGCHTCSIVSWVIDEHNLLRTRTLWTIEGYEREATDVSIVRANDPVGAGEFLEVDVDVRNPASASTTEDVSLVVGGEQVDEATVSVDGDDVETVTLGYETYPVQVDVEFPVTVRTSHDVAHRTVKVFADDAPSLSIDILETRDPVLAGEYLEVLAEVENLREERVETDLALEAGPVADRKTVSLWPGESDVVSMGYHTYPVEVDVEFPVKIRGGGAWDARTVEVFADGASHLSVRIIDTNAPVAAGEHLWVLAEIQNRGTTAVSEEVTFVAGRPADSQTVRIPAGRTVTVRLGYDTYPVQRDVRFPIEVEAGRGWDRRIVEVFTHALPLEIWIADVNDPVTAGDVLHVLARVYNPGTTTVTRDVHLVSRGGWVDTQTVTVGSGETVSVPLQYRTPLVTDHVRLPVVVETKRASVRRLVDVVADHIPIICRVIRTNAPIKPGEPLILTIELENEAESSITEELSFFVEEEQMETATISLDAGATETLDLEAPIEGEYNPEVTTRVEVGPAELTQSIALQEGDVSIEIVDAPDSVDPGESFEVTAELENLGDVEVSDDVALSIDGSEADATEVIVGADETQTVELEGAIDQRLAEEVTVSVGVEETYDETTLEMEAIEADVDVEFASCTRVDVSGTLDDGDGVYANTTFVEEGLIGTTEGEDGIVVGEDVDAPFEGTITFEVAEDAGVSSDAEGATVTIEDRGEFGTAVIGLMGPNASPGETTETNPHDCEGEVSPEEPSLTVREVSTADDEAIEVTFGYENPNDVTIEEGGEFVEGTTDEEPPAELEPGSDEVTVEWAPEGEDERLAWEIDLSGLGLEESVRAETDPAEEYLELEALSVEIVEAPESVESGETFEVSVDLENPGDTEATEEIALFVDDEEVDATEVTVDAAETDAIDLDGEVDDHPEDDEVTVVVEAEDESDEFTLEVGAEIEVEVDVDFASCTLAEVSATLEDGDGVYVDTTFVDADGIGTTEAEDGLVVGEDVDAPFEGTITVEVGEDGGVSGDGEGATVTIEDRGEFGTAIAAIEGPDETAETNPHDCEGEIAPEEPSVTVEEVGPVDAETIEVTFGYENPNDATIGEGGEFDEGTTADEPPAELEAGTDDFTVQWTPEEESERLAWEIDLSGFGLDEAVRAETDPAEEYLEAESLSVVSVETPETVEPGDSMGVSADLENPGDVETTEDVTLFLDGAEADATEVTIGGGETDSVDLQGTVDDGVDAEAVTVTVETEDDSLEEQVDVFTEGELLVSALTTNQPIDAGETLTVDADVENTGDTELAQDVTLLVDGSEEAVEQVTVEGNSTQTASFTYETEPAQEDLVLSVTVETADDTVEEPVEVLGEEEEPPEDDDEPPEEDDDEPPEEVDEPDEEEDEPPQEEDPPEEDDDGPPEEDDDDPSEEDDEPPEDEDESPEEEEEPPEEEPPEEEDPPEEDEPPEEEPTEEEEPPEEEPTEEDTEDDEEA